MHWKSLTFAWCVSLLALTCESQMKFWMSFNISQRVRATTFYSFKWNFGTARNSICSVRWKFEERLLSRPTPNRYWILIIIYNFRLCSTPGAVSNCWVRARRGEALDLFPSVCSEAAGRNREREPGRRKLDWKIFQAQCDRAIEHTHTPCTFSQIHIYDISAYVVWCRLYYIHAEKCHSGWMTAAFCRYYIYSRATTENICERLWQRCGAHVQVDAITCASLTPKGSRLDVAFDWSCANTDCVLALWGQHTLLWFTKDTTRSRTKVLHSSLESKLCNAQNQFYCVEIQNNL